jgi:hypothetical protein
MGCLPGERDTQTHEGDAPVSKKQTINHCYDSAGDFIADISRNKQGVSNVCKTRGDRYFFWTDTYEEAESLLRTGWTDGVKQVANKRDGLNAFLDAAKAVKAAEFAWDTTGDFWDIGRVLSGEPECAGSIFPTGEQQSARVASIRYNVCVSGSVDAKVIAARGIAVLVAVDLLESCGIRCEVIVAQGTDNHELDLNFNVVVKQPNEVVDPDRLAFTVGHPAFFRRFGFRFMELYGHNPGGCVPSRLQDYGKREGTVEIDEILSGNGVSDKQLKQTIIKIAESCGLTFTSDQIKELCNA